MKFKLASLLLFVVAISSCKKNDNAGKTRTATLQIDAYTDATSRAFQSGFVTGETAEVTLGPVTNTFKVTYVRFLLGGNSSPVSRNVILKIYKDAGTANPGTPLFTSTVTVTSSNDNLQQVDLRNENVMVTGGGSIRIALEMTGNGFPSVAVDNDGTISSQGNWIKTGGSWASASSLGLTGDFIIRAVIEENL